MYSGASSKNLKRAVRLMKRATAKKRKRAPVGMQRLIVGIQGQLSKWITEALEARIEDANKLKAMGDLLDSYASTHRSQIDQMAAKRDEQYTQIMGFNQGVSDRCKAVEAQIVQMRKAYTTRIGKMERNYDSHAKRLDNLKYVAELVNAIDERVAKLEHPLIDVISCGCGREIKIARPTNSRLLHVSCTCGKLHSIEPVQPDDPYNDAVRSVTGGVSAVHPVIGASQMWRDESNWRALSKRCADAERDLELEREKHDALNQHYAIAVSDRERYNRERDEAREKFALVCVERDSLKRTVRDFSPLIGESRLPEFK